MKKFVSSLAGAALALSFVLTGCGVARTPNTLAIAAGRTVTEADAKPLVDVLLSSLPPEPKTTPEARRTNYTRGVVASFARRAVLERAGRERGMTVDPADVAKVREQMVSRPPFNEPALASLADSEALLATYVRQFGEEKVVGLTSGYEVQANPRLGLWDPAHFGFVESQGAFAPLSEPFPAPLTPAGR